MIHLRLASLALFGLSAASFTSALAQSVVATHSGLVYFFEGSVFVGDQRLEQKFGRFPDIGEGRVLRTEHGQAEVLLTAGVMLRIGENSAVRLASNKLADTRVELLGGSAIVEANEAQKGTSVRLLYKNWEVRLPKDGVYRIDSEPARVSVYKGDAEIVARGTAEPVAVREGQVLPLAAVLVPEQAGLTANDDFKSWAMSRSQAIASDNATAAGIIDDPSQMDGPATVAGLSYFPLTGIPGVAITNPYGLGFWSPFQSTLSSIYFPRYSYGFLYPVGWPTAIHSPLLQRSWTPTHGVTPLRPIYTPPRTPSYGVQHPGTTRPGVHVGGAHR